MHNNQSHNSSLLWIIGIVSIIAIVLAWMAFNRSGTDVTTSLEREADALAQDTVGASANLRDQVVTTTNNTIDAGQESLARAEARVQLLTMQAELEAEANYDDALASIQSIRTDLRDAYDQAEGSAQENWQAVDNELMQVENSIRTESADALEIIRGAILTLEEDIRTEDQ